MALQAGANRVGIRAEAPLTYLAIQVDGVTLVDEATESAFFREFRADQEVTIEASNGGVVSVEINGQNVGYLGALGEEVEQSYMLEPAGPNISTEGSPQEKAAVK